MIDEQLDLEAEAYARRTDPVTSHVAAVTVDASHLEQVVLDALERLGNATTREISEASGYERVTISPRMAPLRRKGLIRPTDDRRDRSIVWEKAE